MSDERRTYALVYVDGEKKLIKTKPHSFYYSDEAKNELIRDLKKSGLKYNLLGESETRVTMESITRVEKLASRINPPVGTWFATNETRNYTKYNFMRIAKKCGNPFPIQVYTTQTPYIVQEVVMSFYSSKLLKSEGPGYDNYSWYLPDKKTNETKTGYIRISPKGELTVNPTPTMQSWPIWERWNDRKKEPIVVHTSYDPW